MRYAVRGKGGDKCLLVEKITPDDNIVYGQCEVVEFEDEDVISEESDRFVYLKKVEEVYYAERGCPGFEYLIKSVQFAVSLAEVEGPAEDTRKAACVTPYGAKNYGLLVDKGPCFETRFEACSRPPAAYYYALHVDGPNFYTRRAASKSPKFAYLYALNVDRAYHPMTDRGAHASEEYGKKYDNDVIRDIELRRIMEEKHGLCSNADVEPETNIQAVVPC